MLTDGNLYTDLPDATAGEVFSDLLTAPGVRLLRIVSRGQITPPDDWYDQDQGEWVMVLKGAARLRIEGEDRDRDLGPGDYLWLGAHVRHRVTWTDPEQDTVWLGLMLDAVPGGQP